MSEAEARAWPDLWSIVYEKVRPERITKDAKKYPRMVNEWWKFWNARSELYQAIKKVDRVLCISRVTEHPGFVFLPVNMVYADRLVVFPRDEATFFCVLQCRVHEVWARFFSVTLEDRLSYTPTDCFETFAFPKDFETDSMIETAGREYYDFRAALMVSNNEGLTATYNRFHDPADRDPDILRLRELHTAMDRAVLAAYGWPEIPTNCEFIPNYFDESPDGGDPIPKSIRYRWPDAVRDAVLARILKLNAERAEQEQIAGKLKVATKPKKSRKQSTHIGAEILP